MGADDPLTTVQDALRQAEDKYVYFLLAAVGGGIAFAVNQSQDEGLSWLQIPLGAAVLCWGCSFLCGCQRLLIIQDVFYFNANYIVVRRGQHELSGRDPREIAASSAALLEIMNNKYRLNRRFATAQLWTLIVGGVCFLTWRVIEMGLRAHGLPSGPRGGG